MRLPLRKLLSYLCLSNEPSHSLKRLLLFLTPDEGYNNNKSGSISNSNSGNSSAEAAADAEVKPEGPYAPISDVYTVCCGLGFRGPLWGPSPVTILSFADFARAAAEEQLLLPLQQQQQQQNQAASAFEDQGAHSDQQDQQQQQMLLGKAFLKSELFRRVVAASGPVYLRSPLDAYLAAIGLRPTVRT